MKTAGISLHCARKGSWYIIVELPDGKSKAQLIRLGIHKGELVRCLERLPGGTIVVQKNRQEIALGMSLAKSILVARADSQRPQSDRYQK
ncbi:MAG: ferrous iron transport protein A [Ignavibacteria bacterium]|nr:ferrous iron transport protein A [Ignavibacteria bacterium]